MTTTHRLLLTCLLTAILVVTAMKGSAAPSEDDRQWQPAASESDSYDIEYDERSKLYTFYRRDQGKHGTPAKVMNSDEYRRYKFDNALHEAWVSRRSAETGSSLRSGEGSASKLIPDLKLNSKLMSSLLGSDVVSFNIQGMAEAIFGYNWSRTDNPTTPEEYRSRGAFDFKVNMQINASGSIGDRIKIDFINSTGLTFNFQDLVKINYQGNEDDIIQKIEAGNVSLPLSGSLITGSQSLFGFKTELKFGHLTIEGVLSEQQGQSSTINVKGGAQTTLFDISVDKYDANRHFFLAHYFRSQYDNALKFLPLVQSGITIKRLEVWITNRHNRIDNSRNIIALDTLGGGGGLPSNTSNELYRQLKGNEAARNMATTNAEMQR
ncbi:MAG: cell surface protein SprA, partial [Prevotellaceae bacterium]|nr:cell surface protein SprA [Prevotellaceae bacterium]